MFTEINPTPNRGGRLSGPPALSQRPESMSGSGYVKFRNDRGVPCIGVRKFECIGVSPPQDHPHIYIDMGEADTILCPYCGTRFRFDPRLTPITFSLTSFRQKKGVPVDLLIFSVLVIDKHEIRVGQFQTASYDDIGLKSHFFQMFILDPGA